MAPRKKSSSYDLDSYLGRSQYVNSSIDKKTAKQRQNSFKDTVGPAAGVGMGVLAAGGALIGAPLGLAVAPMAGLAYIASKGKQRAERKQKAADYSAAAVKRSRPRPVLPAKAAAAAAAKRSPVKKGSPVTSMKAK